jgi:hypothetical protein
VKARRSVSFRPLGDTLPEAGSGRCRVCRVRLRGVRIKMTHSTGVVLYACLACASALVREQEETGKGVVPFRNAES